MGLTSDGLRDCGSCPIQHRAICSRCEPDELLQLDAIKYYRTYSAGQTMVWSGDILEFFASLVTGIATLSQSLEDGRTQMVGLLLPSDFIGHPGRRTSSYDVTAVTEVTLCCFRQRAFEKILIKAPHVGERLLEMALDELDAAREWMVVLGRKTAREKIASLLEIISRRDGFLQETPAQDGHSFRLPLTREEMANYLGMTLETVSRQISALRRDGIIELESNRQVIIPDVYRLRTEAGLNDF